MKSSKNNYLRFWFAFIYPNRSFIESGQTKIAMDKNQKSLVSNQIAFVYADICREKMWEMYAEGKWPFYFSRLGRYWDHPTEIDIAAIDPDGNNLILGECRYRRDTIGLDVFYALENKPQNVLWRNNNRKVWYVLFNLNGYAPELKEYACQRNDLILA